MSRLLLFSIVFIEGFCSLGAEVIALRQIIPHLGSSIVVTAPTIGFFLLALALGYHAGAKIDEGYIEVVAKNFLLAALLVGIGLAGIGVDLLFTALRPPELAYLLLVAGVLCPIAWLLGQTVPILTNLLLRERAGEAFRGALAACMHRLARTCATVLLVVIPVRGLIVRGRLTAIARGHGALPPAFVDERIAGIALELRK